MNRAPHCEEMEPEELSGCCHLPSLGASAAGEFGVRFCSLQCPCCLIAVIPMGAGLTPLVYFLSSV